MINIKRIIKQSLCIHKYQSYGHLSRYYSNNTLCDTDYILRCMKCKKEKIIHTYGYDFNLNDWEVFNHEVQKTIKISNRANHSIVTWHKSISRFDRYIANYTIASIRQRERIYHQYLLASKDSGVYATDDLRIKISNSHQINSKVTFDNKIPNFFKK